MSAGQSKATEDVLGASKVDRCDGSDSTETGSKGEKKQDHRLRRGEQSLPCDVSREKTSGANKKRDIQ